MTNINYKIYLCSGNPTAIIYAGSGTDINWHDKTVRLGFEKAIMELNPVVEQTGFLDVNEKHLEMAGGEFCGNATRSAIFDLLSDGITSSMLCEEKGPIEITVSGSSEALAGGIDKDGDVYVHMPKLVSKEKLTDNITMVDLGGITHLVIDGEDVLSNVNFKERSLELFAKYNLMDKDACGAIYLFGDRMLPIVRVKASNSLIEESSCGSGITAASFAKQESLNLMQPYGKYLRTVYNNGEVILKGPISRL